LGVSPHASLTEITAAYRRLAMKYHPDRLSAASLSEQELGAAKFKEIQAAYKSLKPKRS
jgi:curved DNA-binding protein CbpA